MLTNNPLLQLALPRVKTVLKRIQCRVWDKVCDLECKALPVHFEEHRSVRSLPQNQLDIVKPGHELKGSFCFYWYCVDMPAGCESSGMFFHWNHEAESTAYIGGTPFAGFDDNHKYVRLPANVKTIWIESATMEEKQALKEAALYQRDEFAWKLKNNLEVLINLIECQLKGYNLPFGGSYDTSFKYRPPMDCMPRSIRRLLRLLEGAADAFEKKGMEALGEKLDAIFAEFRGDPQTLKLAASAQAHLDPVFMWPETIGFSKIIHTFSSSVYLMNEYPEMTHQFSQPYAYEKIRELEPELFAQVKSKLDNGQWEMECGMYVEADTQMPCGEALARSFEIGQKITRDIQGRESTILWLPDTFGFSACLPQIMKQFGMRFFWTTKMQWNTVTHFPYSSFRWHGNDGSEIVAHSSQHYMGYMLSGLPDQMINVEKIYRQGDVHDESIATVGFGDGGGGITAEQIEYVRRIKDLYGVPRTSFRKMKDFFCDLEVVKDSLPQFDGELYLEFHRGVLTTRGPLKAAYRHLERALQRLESLHALQGLGPVNEKYWKRLTFSQFHDILPGSLLTTAAQTHIKELTALALQTESDATELLNPKTKNAVPCIFNPLPVEQNAWVKDDASQKLKCCRIPPHTGEALTKLKALPGIGEVHVTDSSLRNSHVEIVFDRSGEISAFCVHGKDVKLNGSGAVLTTYKEMPADFDAWEVDIQSLIGGVSQKNDAICAITQSDPHCGQLKFQKKIGDQSSVAIYYTLRADESHVRITYELDWKDPETLLKVLFPTHYKGRHVRYGTPFGSCLRPQYDGLPSEVAQWEVAGNRWAAIFDEGEREGLGIVTKDKYGFSARHGTLSVSLIRSPIASESLPHPGSKNAVFTDIGRHVIDVAVGCYSLNLPLHQQPAALADTLYTEPVHYTGVPMQSPYRGIEGGASLLPCWIKPVDKNCWILRLHEISGQHGSVKIQLENSWKWKKVDLSNRELPCSAEALTYTPYEIVSLLIYKITKENKL